MLPRIKLREMFYSELNKKDIQRGRDRESPKTERNASVTHAVTATTRTQVRGQKKGEFFTNGVKNTSQLHYGSGFTPGRHGIAIFGGVLLCNLRSPMMKIGTDKTKIRPKVIAVFLFQRLGYGHHPPAGDHTSFGYGNLGSPPMVSCREARLNTEHFHTRLDQASRVSGRR